MKRKWRIQNKKRVIIVFLFLFLILQTIGMIVFGKPSVHSQARAGSTYYHIVQIQRGDTLWSIASYYVTGDIDIRQYITHIKEFNHMDSDCILAGNYLIIPQREDD